MTSHWHQSFTPSEGLISFCSYFCVSGQMLSLEDGTSSGDRQETEGTKREGPSEYESTLENKNKQVCLLAGVCGLMSIFWVLRQSWLLYLSLHEKVCTWRLLTWHRVGWQKNKNRFPFRSISVYVHMKKEHPGYHCHRDRSMNDAKLSW